MVQPELYRNDGRSGDDNMSKGGTPGVCPNCGSLNLIYDETEYFVNNGQKYFCRPFTCSACCCKGGEYNKYEFDEMEVYETVEEN